MTADPYLIEAVEDAMQDALEEAGLEAVVAALAGEELPPQPDVLIAAVTTAITELGVFWESDGDVATKLGLMRVGVRAVLTLLDAASEAVEEVS